MVIILTALVVFGVVHSWLAGQDVKQWFRRRVGERAYEGFYRLAYNVLAVVMLAPVGLLLVVAPGNIVWQVESAPAALLLNGLRLLGLALLAFNLGTTAYLLLGSLVEERRLVRAFGPAYVRYRQHVPWMLPRLRPVTNVTIQQDSIEKRD